MKPAEVLQALGALAQESRLAVFRLLVKRGPAGHAAGEIATRLDIPPPALTFHLKELALAGLVTSRKSGRHVIYSARFDRMNALLAYLTENCCGQGRDCAPSCAPAPRAPARKQA